MIIFFFFRIVNAIFSFSRFFAFFTSFSCLFRFPCPPASDSQFHPDREPGHHLYPLQIFLKDVLVSNQFSADDMMDPETIVVMENMKLLLKYSLIVVSVVPLFFFYPFVQKYFVKGVMIGSVKG